jgi:aminoglycoside phosphotransferase (APT) family kinase protein
MELRVTASIVDSTFPQIPKILNPTYMLGVLQTAWLLNEGNDSQEIKIESCSVGEKRHKPGKSFMLLYRLGVLDVTTGTCYEQLMSAQLYLPGKGLSEFEASLGNVSKTQKQLPIGIPLVSFIPEVNMLLRAFPHDRKLPHLPKLLDTENLGTYFMAYLAGHKLSSSEYVVAVAIKLMHYLPECSCMLRYTLTIANKVNTNESRQIILYGKNYRDGSGFETYSVMQQLAEQTGYCAKPYAYDAETRTLWQAHVLGEPFEWTSALAANPDLIARVAKCIAAFHSCNLDAARFYEFTDISEQLEATCNIASATNPMLGKQVQAAVQAIRRNYRQMDWSGGVTTPIHLDLKMGNLLISDHKVFLIDMDCVQLGDPLADIGSFVANLYLNGLRFGSDVAQINEVVALFCDGYCAAVDWPVDYAKLNWYIAAALIHEIVRRSLRQQNEDRLKQVSAIIELSKRYSLLCSESIAND